MLDGAVSEGTAWITARPAEEGVGDTHDSVMVTVIVPVTDFRISYKPSSLYAGEEDPMYVEGANQAVSWSSDNSNIAYVDSSTGKLYGNNPGTATITATCGQMSDSFNVTVKTVITQKYYLKSYYSGLFIDGNTMDTGTEVTQQKFKINNSQFYNLIYISDGDYKLECAGAPGNVLTVVDGDRVQIQSYNDGGNQKFRFIPNGNGTYRIL